MLIDYARLFAEERRRAIHAETMSSMNCVRLLAAVAHHHQSRLGFSVGSVCLPVCKPCLGLCRMPTLIHSLRQPEEILSETSCANRKRS